MDTWMEGGRKTDWKRKREDQENYLGDSSGHSGGRWCEIYSTSSKVGGEEWIHFGI